MRNFSFLPSVTKLALLVLMTGVLAIVLSAHPRSNPTGSSHSWEVDRSPQLSLVTSYLPKRFRSEYVGLLSRPSVRLLADRSRPLFGDRGSFHEHGRVFCVSFFEQLSLWLTQRMLILTELIRSLDARSLSLDAGCFNNLIYRFIHTRH